MAKKKWVDIASGEDRVIDSWAESVAPVIGQFEKLLSAFDEDPGLAIDWAEVCGRVPGLRGKEVRITAETPRRDFLQFLELDLGCSVNEEEWDSDMPGQSGTWITVEAEASKIPQLLQTAGELMASVERYLSDRGLEFA